MATCLLLVMHAIAAGDEATSVEEAALARREAITSVECEISSRFFDEQGATVRECKRRIWWVDGGNSRQDVHWLKRADRGAQKFREVVCIADGDVISWSSEPRAVENEKIGISVWRKDAPGSDRIERPLDPRKLGMMPLDSWSSGQFPLNAAVAGVPRSDVDIESVDWRGEQATRVSYTNAYGVEMRVWIVPAWDHSVVKVQATPRNPSVGRSAILEVEISQHRASGLWFPTRCVLTNTRNGVTWREEESAIRLVSLNQTIDPTVFTLRGMDLPAGLSISYVPQDARGPIFWDGKGEVVGPHGIPPFETEKSNWRLWLGWSSAGFAVISAACVYWFFRQRQIVK